MSFSFRGRHFTLGHRDGTITVHEATTGREVNRLSVGFAPGRVALQTDGTKLAVASDEDLNVEVRDMATGRILWKQAHPGDVSSLAWHPNGHLLAVACSDFKIYLWNTVTGRRHGVVPGHMSSSVTLEFSTEGDLLLSSGWDGTCRLWEPWTGRQLVSFPGASPCFSRDALRLACRSGTRLGTWEVARGCEYRTLTTHEEHQTEDISPDGRWLAVVTEDGVQLWDLPLGKLGPFLPLGPTIAAVFHPKGRELFTSTRTGFYRWPFRDEAGSIRAGPARQLPLKVGLLRAGCLDSEGRILAVPSGGTGGGAQVLDLEKEPRQVSRFNHVNAVFAAVSPNGQWVASGTWSGFGVKVWEAHSGKLRGRPSFNPHSHPKLFWSIGLRRLRLMV
jgi:WD40 repeat protein